MAHKHSRNFEEFVDFLKEKKFFPKTVLDVGVCYGTPELQQGYPEAYHILIEPLAELEDRMKALTNKYNGEYHMVALGAEKGSLPFIVDDNNLAGATLTTGASSQKPTRSVPIETLDTLFGDRDIQGPILIKTDCQGFDLDVMKGGATFIEKVDVIIMEVNLFHPAGNTDRASFGQIVLWMQEHNFSVYDIISYQQRPFDGALGYIDLVFVKMDGVFRKDHRWA